MKVISVLFLLALTLAPGQAQAQFVIKRIKCADAVLPEDFARPGTLAHDNISDNSKDLTVQIIRDGCRPKLLDARFELRVRTTIGVEVTHESAIMFRNSKIPSGATVTVDPNEIAYVRFFRLVPKNTSGTFDYMYSWD